MHTEIINKIKDYDTIIIHTHLRPDGDCNGSAFGLKYIIEENFENKKAYVVGQKSEYLSFIGEIDNIDDTTYERSLVIVVDSAVRTRIGDQRYSLGDFIVKIDHHIPVDDYGDISWVDTNYPACAQMISELALNNNLKLNDKALTALFTGILTDTGRFRYRGVSEHTFAIASEFMKLGLNHEYVFNKLSVISEEAVKFKGYILQNIEKTPNGVAFINITLEIISKFNIDLEEASSFINELGVFEDCPIWVLFIAYDENQIRGRIRSKGPTIDHIAAKYNGGGHKLASGITVPTWEDAEDCLNDLDSLSKEYKQNN